MKLHKTFKNVSKWGNLAKYSHPEGLPLLHLNLATNVLSQTLHLLFLCEVIVERTTQVTYIFLIFMYLLFLNTSFGQKNHFHHWDSPNPLTTMQVPYELVP